MKSKMLFVLVLLVLVPKILFADEQIKIGLLTDLSGLGAYWGTQSQVGGELAEEDLNEKGIPVKLIVEDQSLQAKNAVSGAQKLLFADEVDAIYSEFTPTTVAASPVAKNSNKLFMGVCAANSFLKRNPNAFKSYIDYESGCKAVASYWKKQGIKKVASLKAETEYGELCTEGLKQVFPDGFVIDYKYGDSVRTQALLLKKNGAEAVINASFEGDILNMMEAFTTISYAPKIGANFDVFTKRLIEKYPQHSSKFVSFGLQNVAEDFVSRVKAKDPRNSLIGIEGAALAYLHISQMVEAIKACGKKNVSCQVAYLSVNSPLF